MHGALMIKTKRWIKIGTRKLLQFVSRYPIHNASFSS